MRTDAVWNNAGYWESPAFSKSKASKSIKIPITKCEIIVNEFGYIDLYLDGKRFKRITFEMYLTYRDHVKKVIRKDLYQ